MKMHSLRWILLGLAIAIQLTALVAWLAWRTRHNAALVDDAIEEPATEPEPTA